MAPTSDDAKAAAPHLLHARACEFDEREAMLELMCRSFHIDPAAAKTIFYTDPFFDLSMKRVLAQSQGAEIISCLTLVPTYLRLSSSNILPVCGIAGVCTDPDRRCAGHASHLIRETLAAMPAEIPFSITALTAARPSVYEKLGWRASGSTVVWDADIACLPRFAEGAIVRELNAEEATRRATEIHALYQTIRGRSEPGAFVRDERRWRSIEKLTAGRRVAVFDSPGGANAYIAFDVRPSKDGAILSVHEMLARNDMARRALIGFLASGAHGAKQIVGRCSPRDAVAFGLLNTPGIDFNIESNVHLRLSHLTKLLQHLLAGASAPPELSHMPDGLTIRVDGAPPDWEGDGRHHAHLIVAGRHVKVSRAGLGAADRPSIVGCVGAITQLVVGASSAAALVSEGSLRASAPAVVLACEALFPSIQPFLATPDVF